MSKTIILENADPKEYRCLYVESGCLKYKSESYGEQEVEAKYWLDQTETTRLLDRITQDQDSLNALKSYFQDKLTAETFIELCDYYDISFNRKVWWE